MNALPLQIKKVCALILLVALFAPSAGFLLVPREAHAVASGSVVYDPTNWVENALSAANSVTQVARANAEWIKEYVFDPIAFALINSIIRQMTANIIDWINSGFDGNPAFITDLDRHLTNACYGTFDDFVNELGSTRGLNSRSQILLARSIALTDPCATIRGGDLLSPNIAEEAFAQFLFDFRYGGTERFVRMVLWGQNNAYGRYLIASNEASRRLDINRQSELERLGWGDGFLEWKECTTVQWDNPDTPEVDAPRQRCETATPGKVVEHQLNDTLDSNKRRIEIADEIDEIITALMTQLTEQALAGGLRALSGGGNSYTNRLRNESGAISESAKIVAIESVTFIRDTETAYRRAKRTTLGHIQDSENLLRQLNACYVRKSEEVALTPENRSEALSRALSATTTIATRITPEKTRIAGDVAKADANLSRLSSILADMESANSPAEIEEAIRAFREATEVVGTSSPASVFHTSLDVVRAEDEIRGAEEQTTALDLETEEKIAACNVFPSTPPPDETE
ncbi:MAG: hypothetical protein HY455_00480 [Parcubacteria group bacterium]|nr:hypothetical protein [Parcubacteria group bacterium]